MRIDSKLVDELFDHAASSPSAHNTQPWVPRFIPGLNAQSPAEVVVSVDPARTLPVGDPSFEDLHLAMGCWVESFAIAAAEMGMHTVIGSVRGRGPALEIGLLISGADGSADGTRAPTSGWPAFSIADLHHRQVDRGPMGRDQAAFDGALSAINGALEGSGARIVEVPHHLWRPLQRRAALYSTSSAGIFTETLEWLRFDRHDPRYREDGLTAECLRLSPRLASGAAVLNTNALRPWIGGITSAIVSPLALLNRFRPSPARSGTRTSSSSDRTTSASPPHHVVLAVGSSGSGTDDTRVGSEIRIGCELLRIWLLLDQYGLRVDVHSEIKDCPETKAEVVRFLNRADPGSRDSSRRDPTQTSSTATPEDMHGAQLRPIAAFSIGRSTTTVPRSHRLRD